MRPGSFCAKPTQGVDCAHVAPAPSFSLGPMPGPDGVPASVRTPSHESDFSVSESQRRALRQPTNPYTHFHAVYPEGAVRIADCRFVDWKTGLASSRTFRVRLCRPEFIALVLVFHNYGNYGDIFRAGRDSGLGIRRGRSRSGNLFYEPESRTANHVSPANPKPRISNSDRLAYL